MLSSSTSSDSSQTGSYLCIRVSERFWLYQIRGKTKRALYAHRSNQEDGARASKRDIRAPPSTMRDYRSGFEILEASAAEVLQVSFLAISLPLVHLISVVCSLCDCLIGYFV